MPDKRITVDTLQTDNPDVQVRVDGETGIIHVTIIDAKTADGGGSPDRRKGNVLVARQHGPRPLRSILEMKLPPAQKSPKLEPAPDFIVLQSQENERVVAESLRGGEAAVRGRTSHAR